MLSIHRIYIYMIASYYLLFIIKRVNKFNLSVSSQTPLFFITENNIRLLFPYLLTL